MTSEAITKSAKAKKMAIQMIVGAVFGAGSMIMLSKMVPMRSLAADEFILFSVGAIWAIIGVFILFGTASPKVGAKLLNVEDEEDLREQRRILIGSAIIFLTWGSSHMILAVSGSMAFFSAWAGIGAMLISLFACVLIYFRDRHLYDEMMWKLTLHAGYLCFTGLWVVLSVWCAMTISGLVAAPTPEIILALFSGGYLLTTVISAGRAGLLAPK
jgi:hypothetical protein